MIEDYRNALRAGQRAYRACVARGQSPYLKVLDEILPIWKRASIPPSSPTNT